MCGQQDERDERPGGGDAGGDEVGGAEAVEEGGRGGVVHLVGEAAVPGASEAVGDSQRRADRVVSGVGDRPGCRSGERAGQPRGVERRVDAADHGDAERPTEQAGGVVDSGANARLVRGHDAHDRLGRGRAREAQRRTIRSLGGSPEVINNARSDPRLAWNVEARRDSTRGTWAGSLVPRCCSVRSRLRLQRLQEEVGLVWDCGRLLPDDLPAPVAAFVELGTPRLVGQATASDDQIEAPLVAQDGGVTVQPHGYRGGRVVREEVENAGLDGPEELLARLRSPAGIDELEVVGHELAGGGGVRVVQRLRALVLDRAQAVGLRRAPLGSARRGDGGGRDEQLSSVRRDCRQQAPPPRFPSRQVALHDVTPPRRCRLAQDGRRRAADAIPPTWDIRGLRAQVWSRGGQRPRPRPMPRAPRTAQRVEPRWRVAPREAIAELRAVIGFDRWCWPLSDPDALVPLAGAAEHDYGPAVGRSLELEYSVGDFATMSVLARRAKPVGSLSAETRGDLARSPRWDEVLRPVG